VILVKSNMNTTKYRQNIIFEFRRLKEQAEGAFDQVEDADFHKCLSGNDNSIAIIVKHMSGNMRSRWRDFLTADGEKEDRYRDTEFEIIDSDSRNGLMRRWEEGWKLLFDTLENLNDGDITATVRIRHEPFLVTEAIHRQLTHYASHVGQIILLAKHFAGDNWKTLSVAKGKSEAFNANPAGYLDKNS